MAHGYPRPCPFPKCLVSFAFVVCQMAPADELSETLNTLTANHSELEGYQATYELSSNTGQTGTHRNWCRFQIGMVISHIRIQE